MDRVGDAVPQVELHCGLAGLQQIRKGWDSLLERGAAGGYPASPACYESLLRYRHPDPERVQFFSLRLADGSLAGIFPLETRRRAIRRIPFEAWQFPDDPDRTGSHFILAPDCDPGVLVNALLRVMRDGDFAPSLLVLERVEEGSPTWLGIRDAPYLSVTEKQPPVYRFPTAARAEVALEKASAKFRRNVSWGLRRLEKMGTVQHNVAHEVTELPDALDRFLGLEASGWKGKNADGRAILKRSHVERHARGTVELLGAQGDCAIHELCLDGRPVASLVCFLGGGEVFAF